jgi:hypothetical protein
MDKRHACEDRVKVHPLAVALQALGYLRRSAFFSPLPRRFFASGLFFVGELDGLYIAPGIEDMSGFASLLSAVV